MHFSTGRGIIKTLAIFSCHRGVCITPLCSPTQFKGIDLQFTGLCLIKVNIEKPSLWSANLIKAWWNLSTPSGLRGAVIPEQQSSQSQSQSSGMCWGFFRRRRPPQPAALTDSSGIPGWVLMSWGFMLYLVSSPISSEFVFPLIYPKWKTLLLVLYGLCVNVKGLEPVFEWQLCLVFVCFFSSSGFKRNYCDLFTSHSDSFLHCEFFFFFFQLLGPDYELCRWSCHRLELVYRSAVTSTRRLLEGFGYQGSCQFFIARRGRAFPLFTSCCHYVSVVKEDAGR